MALDSLRVSSAEQAFQKKANGTKKAFICIALTLLFLITIFSGSAFYGECESTATSGVNSVGEEWSMFHHDLAHTGISDSIAPVTNQTVWIYNTGGPVSSPLVAGGLVYVGSYDDNFYALNATDGAVVWTYTTGNNVLSPATVAEGTVYFGSWDNHLYALGGLAEGEEEEAAVIEEDGLLATQKAIDPLIFYGGGVLVIVIITLIILRQKLVSKK